MTADKALDFVRKQGVVLVSAKGPVPSLVDFIAGESIKGSWWGHPKGQAIFAILGNVTESPDVLVCRLVGGKITLVHKRLWPALVRLGYRFSAKQLARVRQEHTSSGRHISRDVAFPKWVPTEVLKQYRKLSEGSALEALGSWVKT
ncbi:MAG: hypothetical protein HY921_05410 [Elusimicrobia bacterium]|nr:hypothetical protein [Elusimicrobiota bacterium]